MEVVVTTGAISRAELQSNHHHQQTNTQFFYRLDALPVAQPTVLKHWRENITFHWLAYPELTWGLPTLFLTTNGSWLPWGRVAMPLISPLMPVPLSNYSVYVIRYCLLKIFNYRWQQMSCRDMVKNSNGKNAFNKKQELLKNFLSNNLKKITVKVFVWSVLLYASEKCCLTTEDILRLEAMEMWIWRRIVKINRTDRLSNEEMLQRVGE